MKEKSERRTKAFSTAAGIISLAFLFCTVLVDVEMLPYSFILAVEDGIFTLLIHALAVPLIFLLAAIFSFMTKKFQTAIVAVAAAAEVVYIRISMPGFFFTSVFLLTFAACLSLAGLAILAICKKKVIRFVFWVPCVLFTAGMVTLIASFNAFTLIDVVIILISAIFLFTGLWLKSDYEYNSIKETETIITEPTSTEE